MKNLLNTLLILSIPFFIGAQCDEFPGLVLKTDNPVVTMDDIALAGAPMLWFSADEPDLFDADGKIRLPQPYPFAESADKPVLYYKIKKVYTNNRSLKYEGNESSLTRIKSLDLSRISGFTLEYYHYYEEESGLGTHPHDIERVELQIQIINQPNCTEGRFAVQVKRVVAKAHGLYWFENAFTVDKYTAFPLSILIEEGKHASCTDKNADGIYTPGFDVTEKVNDAWGVRDIISTGVLFSGGFQGWMAKTRKPKSLLVPPNFEGSKSYNILMEDYPNATFPHVYELRAFPDLPDDYSDKILRHLVEDKKFKEWPEFHSVNELGNNIVDLLGENKYRNKFGVALRLDEDRSLSFSFPLLFFKHVEAPMTGGWLYNRIYFGTGESVLYENGDRKIGRLFGHQIQHSTSASRWLDSYVGFGYEIIDEDFSLQDEDFDIALVTELGLKLRINITKTPLKFLRYLGSDYWGVRIGWKNLGFNPFIYSGFVVEIGAGAF